jgi:predicted TIM-barrel fold metal-dependent hydrolase
VLHAGVLEELPDLNLIFTAIGAGALVLAAAETEQYSAQARRNPDPRPNIYFDLMGVEPAVIRYLVELVGADRVLVGSDWPIWAPVSRAVLQDAFARAGLSDEDQARIASGNARRLLDRRASDQAQAAE